MDLIKIGKYIAGKRKRLGLTQRQLAEKLNMSDKSVSKWERGICLPDVSIYTELCGILEISINELLAGEDIRVEDMVQKSEANLIQIAKDNKHRQKSLKRALVILALIAALTTSIVGSVIAHHLHRPQNYIVALDRSSTEMKTAELLSDVGGAYLFRYFTGDVFDTLTMYITEYRFGEQISKEIVADLIYDGLEPTTEGMIALVPDLEKGMVKLTITDQYAKYSTEIPILEDIEKRKEYGRSATQIQGITPILYDSEQGLAALIYSIGGLEAIPVASLQNEQVGTRNDHVYYFSFQFGK